MMLDATQQVVSGAMARFIAWLNEDNPALDPVLKAGIAHLDKDKYYDVLEKTQKGDGDITE